ncbi:hypothetical protein [Mucilaginibacter sp. HD30]
MIGLQSFAAPQPAHYSFKKPTLVWLPGYNGQIALSGGRTLYINGSYPGTITDMVIQNSDTSLTTVTSWSSGTTDDTVHGGYKYIGHVYYLNSSYENVFMFVSSHIETDL